MTSLIYQILKSSDCGGLADTMVVSCFSGTCGAEGNVMVTSEIKAGNILVIKSSYGTSEYYYLW